MIPFKMAFFTGLWLCVLLGTVTLATPSGSLGRPMSDLSTRAETNVDPSIDSSVSYSSPFPIGESTNSNATEKVVPGVTINTSQWTGAVFTIPPPGTYKASTQFVVPNVTGPSGTMTCWVAIGGWGSNNNSGVQAGVQANINNGGPPTYFAFFEWEPEGPILDFDLDIEAGDEIAATVQYDPCSSNGNATIENLSIGQQSTKSLGPAPAGVPITPGGAPYVEWNVMIPAGNAPPVLDFGSITFTNCVVAQTSNCVPNYSAAGPNGLVMEDLLPNGMNKVVTQATLQDASTFVVKYTG